MIAAVSSDSALSGANQCFLFQNELKYILDTLIGNIIF